MIKKRILGVFAQNREKSGKILISYIQMALEWQMRNVKICALHKIMIDDLADMFIVRE